MATQQLKRNGAIVGLVSLALLIGGSIYATGGAVVAVQKDIVATDLKIDTKIEVVNATIKSVQGNASEDRESVKELARIVSLLKDKQDADYKEWKEDSHASELRDERQTTQYGQILSHMTRQTAHDTLDDSRNRQIEVDIAEIKVQIKTLIPE